METTTEKLQEATEQLCHNCKQWQNVRWSWMIMCGPRGSHTEYKSEPSPYHCIGSLTPLTTQGEDCPYFERKV